EDTQAVLARYPDLRAGDLPLDFLQHKEPKLLADSLEPVDWPADPSMEWCPPGHGDLYTALLTSGVLDRLIDEGYRYATVSNSDNLGAAPDPQMMAWFAQSG
ncbi:UTP--glucose-1-phosphate uridylyltransferase, partial [Aeromicrobium phragmitis]